MGLGDAAGMPPSDQVQNLQAQINRFGTGAPAGLQVQPTPLPVTGVLDSATAQAALAILEVRLTRAFAPYPGADDANKASLAQLLQADPMTYVLANFSAVLSTIQGYADSLRLPAATPIIVSQVVSALGGEAQALAVIGGAALLFYYLGRRL